jgi:putative flippase GtrA
VNSFIRWGKFNLVGAMGMVVQLVALALFNRSMAGHYLYASAAAIELTLLHNFVCHLHYTWRDRRESTALLSQLIRFHLSNGLVSMLGNLALMRVFVDRARLPLLAANCIAIVCCSMVNFCLGDNWVFAGKSHAAQGQASILCQGDSGPADACRCMTEGIEARSTRGCRTHGSYR